MREIAETVNPYTAPTSSFDLYSEVESSNINAIASAGQDLYVKFNTGVWYRYVGAGFQFTSMLSADSIGKFFHSLVKPLYTCFKINEDGSEEKV